MKTTEALEKVCVLSEQIKHFLLEIGYTAEMIEIDKNNPDDNLYSDEFCVIAFDLEDILTQINYIQSPVIKEGILRFKNNHFFIDNIKLAPETIIEILNRKAWQKYVVYEVDGVQSISDLSQFELENKKVRLREQPGDLGFYYREISRKNGY